MSLPTALNYVQTSAWWLTLALLIKCNPKKPQRLTAITEFGTVYTVTIRSDHHHGHVPHTSTDIVAWYITALSIFHDRNDSVFHKPLPIILTSDFSDSLSFLSSLSFSDGEQIYLPPSYENLLPPSFILPIHVIRRHTPWTMHGSK